MELRTKSDNKWIPSINGIITKVDLNTHYVNSKFYILLDKSAIVTTCFLFVEIREGLKGFFLV